MKRSSRWSPLEALESVKIRRWTFLTAARAASGNQACAMPWICGKPIKTSSCWRKVPTVRSLGWGGAHLCLCLQCPTPGGFAVGIVFPKGTFCFQKEDNSSLSWVPNREAQDEKNPKVLAEFEFPALDFHIF